MKKIKIAIVGIMVLIVVCCGVIYKRAVNTGYAMAQTTNISTTKECLSTTALNAEATRQNTTTAITTTTAAVIESSTASTKTNTEPHSFRNHDNREETTLLSTTKASKTTTSSSTTERELSDIVTQGSHNKNDVCESCKPGDAVKELDRGVWVRQNGKVVVFVKEGDVRTFSSEAAYNECVKEAQNYRCPYCGKNDCGSIERTYSYSGVLIKSFAANPQYCSGINSDGTTGELCEFCSKPFMEHTYYVKAGYPSEYCNGTCNWERK